MDMNNARQVVLEVVNEFSEDDGSFQSQLVLREVVNRLDVKGNVEAEQAVLTIWHDMFRVGLIAPGYDLMNPNLPFVHLTESGRKTLSNLSRDPSNPDGYHAHLKSDGLTDPIALSYIEEGVATYNNGCFKAAAVMVGCATERLVLMIRDELTEGFNRKNITIPNKLKAWQYKTVRDTITAELSNQKQNMDRSLRDSYLAFWVPLTEQPRTYRNDAGHPKSVDPVSQETVHSNLLIFPEMVKLASKILRWIKSHYN